MLVCSCNNILVLECRVLRAIEKEGDICLVEETSS